MNETSRHPRPTTGPTPFSWNSTFPIPDESDSHPEGVSVPPRRQSREDIGNNITNLHRDRIKKKRSVEAENMRKEKENGGVESLPTSKPKPGSKAFFEALRGVTPRYHPWCDWNRKISCSTVTNSPYSHLTQFIPIPFTASHVFPIPNMVFAFFLYLVELGCVFYAEAMFYLTALGVMGTIGVVTIQVWAMVGVCPVQVSLYVLNALSFAVAHTRRRRVREFQSKLVKQCRSLSGAFATAQDSGVTSTPREQEKQDPEGGEENGSLRRRR